MIDENVLYFRDWRIENGYKCRALFVNDMACDGYSEDEMNDIWNSIVDLFWQYCDDNNLEGEYE